MSRRILLVTLVAFFCASSVMSVQAEDDENKSVGFTWWNDVPKLVEEGNQAFEDMDYETSEQYYRDAMVLNPDEAVTSFNLGLAKGQQGESGEALSHFYSALDKAGENKKLKQKALYNIGVGQWKQVMKELEKEDQQERDEESMMKHGLAALDAFNSSLKLNPQDAKALENKNQIQHFLQKISEMPPEQQQQQQGQDQQNNDDQNQQNQQDQQQNQNQQQQNQDQQQQQQQQQQEQQESDQQQQQNDQQQQDQQESEQKEEEQQQSQQQQQSEQEQQEEQEEQQAQAAEEQDREQMTPEQARQMLNILGEDQNIVLRKGRSRSQPQPAKRW